MAETGIDAKLTLIAGGLYDISIDSVGDIETEDFFDTAILVSLFAERRATESEVPESHRRRGWIGNERTPGIEIGSSLWQFDQSRLTSDTINGVRSAASEGLVWFVEDDLLDAVESVEPVVTTTGLSLELTLRRPNGLVEKRFFDLWQNTGIAA